MNKVPWGLARFRSEAVFWSTVSWLVSIPPRVAVSRVPIRPAATPAAATAAELTAPVPAERSRRPPPLPLLLAAAVVELSVALLPPRAEPKELRVR